MSSPTLNLVLSAGFLVFPLSFAYAILRHRLFDVRVIIRRGLQYALARGVLLSIPLVLAGPFAAAPLPHRHEPPFSPFLTRRWFFWGISPPPRLPFLPRRPLPSSPRRSFFPGP